MKPQAPNYQPFYCEENVWRFLALDQAARAGAAYAMFITNEERAVPMWAQRASPGLFSPIAWDYHVVALVKPSDEGSRVLVYDQDHTGALPQPLSLWLKLSFPYQERIPQAYQPRFRLIEGAQFLERFSTDRSHMLDERGRWKKPPPSWPCPRGESAGEASNLERFLTLSDPIAGEILELAQLKSRWSAQD